MSADIEYMEIHTPEEVIKRVLSDMDDILNIKSSDIPNIDLYMDQVLGFLDEKLKNTQRSSVDEDEKILTKTMINNYAKNDLLPPPVKKKYSKEHMMVLIYIYYFKNFLSINDIQTMLKPVEDKYFQSEKGLSVEDLYDEILRIGEERIPLLKENLLDKYEASQKTFEDVEGEDGDYLRLFAYICLLSYDVFVKKVMIEQFVEEIKKKEILNGQAEKKKGDKKK